MERVGRGRGEFGKILIFFGSGKSKYKLIFFFWGRGWDTNAICYDEINVFFQHF